MGLYEFWVLNFSMMQKKIVFISNYFQYCPLSSLNGYLTPFLSSRPDNYKKMKIWELKRMSLTDMCLHIKPQSILLLHTNLNDALLSFCNYQKILLSHSVWYRLELRKKIWKLKFLTYL